MVDEYKLTQEGILVLLTIILQFNFHLNLIWYLYCMYCIELYCIVLVWASPRYRAGVAGDGRGVSRGHCRAGHLTGRRDCGRPIGWLCARAAAERPMESAAWPWPAGRALVRWARRTGGREDRRALRWWRVSVWPWRCRALKYTVMQHLHHLQASSVRAPLDHVYTCIAASNAKRMDKTSPNSQTIG